MATQFAVDLVFKSQGASQLRDATDQLSKLEQKAKGAQQGAAGAANGIKGFGRAAAGASAGVRTLGAAVQAALGPLAIAGGAISALTAAFQTLAQQDFAEAKVRSLGTNSEELVAQLKKVSGELKGQASVVELTGAAYDVASAGFVKAADAAKVLKAASLGATGGFSDINTVGNAATSVLNAYGLSADHAAGLVDKFIQTQNDGKIVVAEYASNIGKVAAAAAGLGIPLSEVNAVIAQATASGVQAEVAFTGLKSALARLASGEAAKELEGFGIKIDAASIEADGLYGTLAKLQGLDTGTLFKVLGTEAAPALLPVIQNLERFEELIKKQEGSAGAAARAQAEAANTIQGAWTSVQTAFSNFFSEQSALGDALKYTLLFVAETVKITAAALNLLLGPIKSIIDTTVQLVQAFDEFFGITQKIDQVRQRFDAFSEGVTGIFEDLKTTISALWSGFIDELGVALSPLKQQWEDFTAGVASAWEETTTVLSQYWSQTVDQISSLAAGLGGFVIGVWNSIANGASSVVAPITNAFQQAFANAWSIIQGFWNSLPAWLRGALSAAGSVVGGVASAVGNALNRVKGEIGKAVSGSGKPAPAGGTGTVPKPTGTATAAPTGGGGGGGGGKGGGGAKERESQVPQLTAELALKQKLFALDGQIAAAKLAGNKAVEAALEMDKVLLERQGKIDEINRSKVPNAEKELQIKLATLDADQKLADASQRRQEAEKTRQEKLDDILGGMQREGELALAVNDQERQRLELEQKIAEWKKDGVIKTEAEAQAIRNGNAELQRKIQLGEQIKSQQAQIQSLYDGIGSTIANGIGSAIDAVANGTENLGETLQKLGQQILAQVGKMLIFYALAQAFGALAGPGGGGIFGALAKAFGGGRASGGPVSPGTSYIVGENGPELLQMGASGGTVYGTNDNRTLGAMGRYRPQSGGVSSSVSGDSGEGDASSSVVDVRYSVDRINEVNYVTEDAFRRGMQQAAKQGAQGGYSKTLGAMRNSRSTRARLGMS